MKYAISAVPMGSSTEQAVSARQGSWEMEKSAGQILNLQTKF
jgi:hypothetical protein